jgi:hypothetical protein
MFMRPTTPEVHAQRDAVDGICPVCQARALQRYRVLSEGGWWNVVKCSQCLHSVSREPGPLLGPLSEALHALIPTARTRKE